MNTIETFEHAGLTVRVVHDPDCESPREWDNLAHLVCYHRRYELGDEQRSSPETEEELRERVGEILALLPLYLYDHSGLSISTGAFSCPWDSGQVGWAYITPESAKRMGCEGLALASLEKMIQQDVSTYDDYLTGRCYGFVVETEDGEELDSCWGFVGDLEFVCKQGRESAEYQREKLNEEEALKQDFRDTALAEEMSARATYAGPEVT